MSVIILFTSFTCFTIVCYFSLLKFVNYLKLEKNKKVISPKIKKVSWIHKITACLGIFAGIFLLGDVLIKAKNLFPDLEQVLLFCSIAFILLTFYVALTILYPIRLLELNLDKEI